MHAASLMDIHLQASIAKANVANMAARFAGYVSNISTGV